MRQTGWYRVKWLGVWNFDEYTGTAWWMPGTNNPFKDSDFDEINETPINPEP